MPKRRDTADQAADKAAAPGRPPADGSGRDLLGRVRALAESVCRQLAARHRVPAVPPAGRLRRNSSPALGWRLGNAVGKAGAGAATSTPPSSGPSARSMRRRWR